MENKNTTTSELFQNPIKNCRNKKKIDTIITHTNVHASSLPWLGIDTVIKRGRVLLVLLWLNPLKVSEMKVLNGQYEFYRLVILVLLIDQIIKVIMSFS
jgi:hypothetical protein